MKRLALQVVKRLNRAGYKSALSGALRRGLESKTGHVVTLASPGRVVAICGRGVFKWFTTCLNFRRGLVYVRSATPETWGAVLLYYTGPYQFKKCICADARVQGLKLSPSGLWLRGERIAGRTERQIFESIGLPFVSAKKRWHYMSKWRENER